MYNVLRKGFKPQPHAQAKAKKLKMSLRFFVYRNTIHSKADYEKTLKTFKDIEAVVIADNEKNPRNGDQPLSSVLSANGWFPDTPLKKTVGWLLDYDYGVKSALISSRHYAGLPEENEFVTDSRGLKGIIDYLAQNITSKIKTEKVVIQIKYSSDGIEVRTKDNETYKAKYGLCTFSTGVLASDLVEFIPELPKWKKEAISRIPLAYYTNIFVKFPNAFWEDNEFIINAGSIAETFPHLYNLNKKGIHEGSNVLLFTAVEENSLRIETQSKNETIAEVMKTLREMYPNVSIPQPTGKQRNISVNKFSRTTEQEARVSRQNASRKFSI
jgi:polyamine oxidase